MTARKVLPAYVSVMVTVLTGPDLETPLVICESQAMTIPTAGAAAPVVDQLMLLVGAVGRHVDAQYPEPPAGTSPRIDVVCFCDGTSEHRYGTGPVCSHQ